MTFITISNFKYVICLSIASRILVFILQFASNKLIKDHEADAYRNRYFQTLSNGSDVIQHLPPSDRLVYSLIEGFTKWDSQYFIEISKDGYVSEQHLAFLPLFPLLISFIRRVIFEHEPITQDIFSLKNKYSMNNQDEMVTSIELQTYIRSALIGFSMNNFVLFPLASLAIYLLTKLVRGHREKYARNVVWWFCFNPASIFFSSCYTESLFSMLTFSSLTVIEYKSRGYISGNESSQESKFVPLTQLNRILQVCIPSIALIALSTATRSNGLITIGFIGYQMLLKYAPMRVTNHSTWTFITRITFLLECVQDLLVLFMSAVVGASGFISFQIYSYIKFCIKNQDNSKGLFYAKPRWCDNWLPQPYKEVQSKYWNVGLFRYYEIKQLPNFLVAMPLSYIVLVNSLKQSKQLAKSRSGKLQVPFYIQAVLLTIFCGLSINIQVTTRILASSCPAVYWICEDVAERSRLKGRVLSVFFLLYLIIGTVLHTTFYPWT